MKTVSETNIRVQARCFARLARKYRQFAREGEDSAVRVGAAYRFAFNSLIPALKRAEDQPCGYYCSEEVGHVDHREQ